MTILLHTVEPLHYYILRMIGRLLRSAHPGATHGSYILTAPEAYRQRVMAFITAALK
jgi:hypothetical protein